MRFGQTIEHGVFLQTPAKPHLFVGQRIHDTADRITRIEPQVKTPRHLTSVFDDTLNESPRSLSRVNLSLPKRRMEEAVSQAMTFASAVVIAIDREAGNLRMVNRVAIVTVVTAALLLTVNHDRKAIDVDGGSHHGVIARGARTAQVAMRPIEQAVAKCLTVFRKVGQPIDQSRLRGLTGKPLLEHFFARTIPSGHPHRRIVGEAVEVVLVFVAEGEGIQPFTQQLRGGVANLLWIARIGELFGQRFDQPKLVIEFSQQDSTGVRSDSLLARLNFDRPVEFRFKESTLRFTHRVILPCKGIASYYPIDAEDHAMVLFISLALRE